MDSFASALEDLNRLKQIMNDLTAEANVILEERRNSLHDAVRLAVADQGYTRQSSNNRTQFFIPSRPSERSESVTASTSSINQPQEARMIPSEIYSLPPTSTSTNTSTTSTSIYTDTSTSTWYSNEHEHVSTTFHCDISNEDLQNRMTTPTSILGATPTSTITTTRSCTSTAVPSSTVTR